MARTGIKILFWSEEYRPQDLVRTDVPREKREAVAIMLKGGERGAGYRGIARCRICGAGLGNSDMMLAGFTYPQRAEHYVLKHDVWVPELDDLFSRVLAGGN